jgi:hypothetical protein
MTPQENQAVQDFLNQLTQVRGVAKDPQADALIARAVSQQPDAAYLLVQRAMLLEQALNNAKAQIAQLQNQAQAVGSSSTGFLDSGAAWGRSAVDAPRQATPATLPASAQSAPQMQSQTQAARPSFMSGMGSGAGSFLGNVAATAAGVAGGAFLFQGIGNLLGQHNQGAGLLGGDKANLPTENTTANNHDSGDSGDNSNSSLSDTDLGNLDANYDDTGNDGLDSI